MFIWASVLHKTVIILCFFMSKMVAQGLLWAAPYQSLQKIHAHLMCCNKEPFIGRVLYIYIYTLFISIYVESPWESTSLLLIQPFLAVLPRLSHQRDIKMYLIVIYLMSFARVFCYINILCLDAAASCCWWMNIVVGFWSWEGLQQGLGTIRFKSHVLLLNHTLKPRPA